MMFDLIKFIVFLIFGPMNTTYEYSVFSLLVVFTLGDTRVHIDTSDCGNVLTNVEASVN